MPPSTPSDLIVLDLYARLSHKQGLDGTAAPFGLAPGWIDAVNSRRLTAYKILFAYLNNTARLFLRDDPAPVGRGVTAPDTATPPAEIPAAGQSKRDAHREYGDAYLICEAVRAAVIGDAIQIQVDGADNPLPDDEDPAAPGDDDTDDDEGQADPEAVPGETDEEAARRRAETEAAIARQEWLDAWADSELLQQKVVETERNATGLGDGVYVVAWSDRHQRPRLRVYDPGFYFPVLNDDNTGDYPDTVHIAWEFEDEDEAGNLHRYVRRLTYDLRRIGTRPDGSIDPNYEQQPGDKWDEKRGRWVRQLPYHENGETADRICYHTDATWKLEDIGKEGTLFKFGADGAEYETVELADGSEAEINQLDLGLDFLPVLHVPNTVAILDHFGQSTIAAVAQILDDIAAADTDLAKAAALAGTPPLAFEGGNVGGRQVVYGPGTTFSGKVTVVDTGRSLDGLAKYVADLLKRLSVNARTPEEVLGRIKMADIPSGVTLALGFGPFRALVNEMRLVRDEKYGLLWKMVQRTAIAGGVLSGPPLRATAQFGAYLPSDLAAVVELVVALLERHGLSRRTALELLVEAGLELPGSIDDELRRIQAEDLETANALVDLTGDANTGLEYLGRDPVEAPPVSVPTLDGGGGPGGDPDQVPPAT